MVTDLATFGWLADVFVLPGHDGTGLGTAMVETIVTHPDVAMIGRQVLATKDAHGLYAKFGYQPLESPQLWMLRQV
jgi:GNAT superfamily N-acetyltransferase